MIKAKKSQSWSIDVTLGVIIFMAAFFVFYALLSAGPNAKMGNLKEDATTVIRQVASEESPLSIVVNNSLNANKLDELKNLSYDELKRRLRIEGDFCIYIEDEKGNIIPVNNYKGVGASSINLSGTPCSQK